MSEMLKQPADGTPVILAIYENGRVWWRPDQEEKILAGICSTAVQEGAFLDALLRAAAALLANSLDFRANLSKFTCYAETCRDHMEYMRDVRKYSD